MVEPVSTTVVVEVDSAVVAELPVGPLYFLFVIEPVEEMSQEDSPLTRRLKQSLRDTSGTDNEVYNEPQGNVQGTTLFEAEDEDTHRNTLFAFEGYTLDGSLHEYLIHSPIETSKMLLNAGDEEDRARKPSASHIACSGIKSNPCRYFQPSTSR